MTTLSPLLLLIIAQTLPNPICGRLYQRPSRYHSNRRPVFATYELESLPFWNCDFAHHDCGIRNQYNMNSYFHLHDQDSEPVFDKRGMLYLDVMKSRSSGARLITPYFPANGWRDACLTIEYIRSDAITRIYLIQQDDNNYCIWQTSRSDTALMIGWTNTSVTIDLTRGNPRFFIEARIDRGLSPGFVAIANIRFQYGSCDTDDRNDCELNPFIYYRN